MMSKICNQCNLEKILDDFPNKNTGKYGKLAQCKSCDKINQHNRYLKNRVDRNGV